jgi:effector-binding domain-containing protein
MKIPPFRFWALCAAVVLRLAAAAGAAETGEVAVRTLPDTLFICVKGDALPQDVNALRKDAIGRLTRALAVARLDQVGPLQFMGPKWNGMGKVSSYVTAIPVRARKPIPSNVEFLDLPARRVATMLNRGPASSIAGAWDHLREVAASRGLKYTTAWTEVQLEVKDSPTADSLIELQLGLD